MSVPQMQESYRWVNLQGEDVFEEDGQDSEDESDSAFFLSAPPAVEVLTMLYIYFSW